MGMQLEDDIVNNEYENNYKESSISRKIKVEGSSRVNKYKVASKNNVINVPNSVFRKKINMSSSSSMKDIDDIMKNGYCL